MFSFPGVSKFKKKLGKIILKKLRNQNPLMNISSSIRKNYQEIKKINSMLLYNIKSQRLLSFLQNSQYNFSLNYT